MKRFAGPFLALALLALAACQPERHTPRDYYAILPELVRVADADARENAYGPRPEGPLFVDVASFAGGGYFVTHQTLNRDSITAAMNLPAGAVRLDDARAGLVLEDSSGFGGRYVQQYGVVVRMNLTKWDAESISATVTNYTTDRRSFPTDICRRVLRVDFAKTDGAWKKTEQAVRKRCEDPD
ncbi:MAG TPA: hypothetical protein VFQ39_01505 [Longimicrobium sp.]|nr:hypothetical protein [Longimicrobium sp.]